MNAFAFSLETGNSFSAALLVVPRRTILLPVLLLVLVCQQIAVGQADDFDDRDDNGWLRYDPLGTATFSFTRSEEHTSELQSHSDLVCRLLLEKKKNKIK